MLLVQEFLEKYSFKDLQEQHGVYVSFSKSGHKFSLNYDQIEAKESDPLAQECRGLILASIDGKSFTDDAVIVNGKFSYDHICPGKTTVLAYPMHRFFNYGQGSAAEIDFSDPNLSVLEKMDGTLCIVYYDWFTEKWCVATRSVPEADLFMDNGIFTFRTLFEKALFDTVGLSFDEYTQNLLKDITYCFELTTPYNRIVVYYPDNRITLLAARQVDFAMNSGYFEFNELDLKNVNSHGVTKVQAHTYTSISELLDWVSSLNPMEHEGIVILDAKFNRIKVKNINYVMYNRARDILCNDRAFLGLILNEKDDDFMELLPTDFQKRVVELKQKLNDFKVKIMNAYTDILKQSSSKKEFAMLVQQRKLWGAPFYQLFDKKCNSFKEFIALNKSKIDSSFSNSFLDKILELL